MEEKREDSRHFHDAWAFILYLILTTLTTCWMVSEMKEFPKYNEEALLPLLTINVGLMLVFLLVAYLGLRYTAKGFIFLANIVAPAIIFFISMLTLNPFVILFAGITFGVSLMFYFWYIKPALPLIAAMVETTAKILSLNLMGCTILLLGSVSLQVIQSFIFLRVLGNNDANIGVMSVLFILNSYWTFFNTIYFAQVVVSAIVVNHAKNGKESFRESFYIAFMALGSISFAGLIMAAINTAKLLLERERERNRERGSGNFINIILLCLLSIVGDLANLMNELVFPYLTLHGTKYTESIGKSYNLIEERGGVTLLSNAAIGKVIFFCFLFFVCFIACGNATVFWANPSFQSDELSYVTMSIVCAPLLTFVYSFLSMFSSGTLALIYSYLEFPDQVRSNEPELIEKIALFS
ncbi:uncharacterized protein Eint_010260 [Encephalitozoon intestinalis ATCC 50506]|uniref:Protein PNS1 n=1 Tax=Encephalitozoon intestinalis (strain ATCC 50506) TaxID=876142 RepID=E0S5A5_ENCIT|nr:uncharacterized protein Eint_010260 [Encephalitozoon intestinalis ATCC 50506]ADM10890.1 hypothetical protein Eint_010260 [Encephalitozoon intestinalis ATCC 50506]UTX44522.1 plasma-membrane choline-transporter [Encephalitozoon intestinalis]